MSSKLCYITMSNTSLFPTGSMFLWSVPPTRSSRFPSKINNLTTNLLAKVI